MSLGRSLVGVALVAVTYGAVALVGKDNVDVPLTIACSLVLAVAMVLVANRLRIAARAQFAVWFSLLFLNFASVAVEGTLFAPALAAPAALPWNLLRLAVGSAAIAGLMGFLFGQENGPADWLTSRSPLGWTWRLLAVAAVYLVVYLVLGGLNYTFVTHPYYETHSGRLTVPSTATILAYEPVRGLLIGLSLLPLTLALRAGAHAAVSVALVGGVMLFVVGGVVPLLPQTSLPLYLRVASLWEIFGQNFLTGVAAAYLFTTWRQRRRAVNA